MHTLRQVKRDYDPGYPRSLTQAEILELLRPGLFARFSSKTMLAGAMLAGAALPGCGAEKITLNEHAPAKPVPKHATTGTDAALKAKVDQLVTELLGSAKEGHWGKHTSLRLSRDLANNPPIKYPSIPISYGNSYVGLFDTEAAKQATFKLFSLYGIEMKSNVPVEGKGFLFEADGYDEKSGIGFKIVMPEEGARRGADKPQAAEKHLDMGEIKMLDNAIKLDQLHLFVAGAGGFPNMDGDLYTPMEYYLASVVDYLNWIHGDKQIELTRVLGKLPGGHTDKSWRELPPLPGCDFENAGDEAAWKVERGTIARSDKWSRHGNHSLQAALEPGGKLVYTVPDGSSIELDKDYRAASCGYYLDGTLEEPLTFSFTFGGDDGSEFELHEQVTHGGGGNLRLSSKGSEKGKVAKLKTVTIRADHKRAITIYLDDLGVSLPRKE